MTSSTSLPIAPAPWTLTGEGYTFITQTPFSVTPIPMPAGAFDPFEEGTTADRSAQFHGGAGMIMLVRYTTSPVGPYDELLCIPGQFAGADGKYALAISRIYVSSPASVMNGRKNWGIPKHLASFTFEPVSSASGGPSLTLVTVSHPSTPSAPFFKAHIRPSRLPLTFPIRMSWLNTRFSHWLTSGVKAELIQPRVPGFAGASEEQLSRTTAVGEDPATLVASEEEYRVVPEASGWSRMAYITPVEKSQGGAQDAEWDGFGDGIGFPKFVPILGGRGAKMDFEMVFTVPEVVPSRL